MDTKFFLLHRKAIATPGIIVFHWMTITYDSLKWLFKEKFKQLNPEGF